MNTRIRELSLVTLCLVIIVSVLLPASIFAGEPAASGPADDVISLNDIDFDNPDSYIAQYADQFNNQDVQLRLYGDTEEVVSFLSPFSFHSLDLDLTPSEISTYFYFADSHLSDIPGLTKLTANDGFASYFSEDDVYEDLTDLTLMHLDTGFHVFGRITNRQMPALEHLTLIFKNEGQFNDMLSFSSLHRFLLPSSLQTIEVRLGETTPTIEELGSSVEAESLSVFLGLLLGNCPNASLNGTALREVPALLAGTINPDITRTALTDAYICSVYEETIRGNGENIAYTYPDPIYGKILFAAIDTSFGLTDTSMPPVTEDAEDERFLSDVVPQEILADSIEDADMLVICYDENTAVGFYTYGGNAYQVDTMVLVKDLNTGTVYNPYVAVSNDPPDTITVTTINGAPIGSSGYGDFEPETAAEQLIAYYNSSIPGKASIPAAPEPAPVEEPVPDGENIPAEPGTADVIAIPSADQEFLNEVLTALNNPVYNDTLAALQNGETINYGAYSTTASGLQQTLVDFGCDIAVDGSAGPGTFAALNQVLGAFGKENTDFVDAAVYSELLPLLLIAQDTDGMYDDLLRSHYGSTGDPGELEYLKGCVYYAQEHYYRAWEAFADSAYQDYEERMAACVQPWPANGEMWHNSYVYGNDMLLSFQVNSYAPSDGMYFEVYTQDGTLASTLFLTGSGTVSTYLPGGVYRIKDCTGDTWYGMKDTFGRNGSYEFMSFYELEEDEYLTVLSSGYEWTISINVTEGNPDATGVGSVDSDWESWTAQ